MRTVIVPADNAERIGVVRELFLEYAAGLGFSLCFQSFEQELAALPGGYSFPNGILLLALADDQPAGCVALRKLDEGICEMKRLYVRPQYRGAHIGHELIHRVLQSAIAIGYSSMRLDTVADRMPAAVALYRRLGFVEIPPYRQNPIAGALYMELDLKALPAFTRIKQDNSI